VALGGNALGNSPEEQLKLVKGTARPIVDLVEKGCEVIIGHGNGPQVGMINLAMEFSANKGGGTPYMPFPECGAMTQGYIGYHLQQAIQDELKARGIKKSCATVVTQVVVDEADPGFQKPTKPVGSFYTKEEADAIAAEKGFTFVEVLAACPTNWGMEIDEANQWLMDNMAAYYPLGVIKDTEAM
jgi:carbamate kinase